MRDHQEQEVFKTADDRSPSSCIERAIRKLDTINTGLLDATEKDAWKHAVSDLHDARRELAEISPNLRLARRQIADALDDLLPFRDTHFSGITIRDEYMDLCRVQQELTMSRPRSQ